MLKPIIAALTLLAGTSLLCANDSDPLARGFANPPNSARLRSYWWWLNGNVTKEAITRDLEQMKAKGFGGALICDASGAEQDGNARVPHGPTFFSPEWRELFKHTVREADRLGLELSLNLQSGWNLGGPIVKPEEASKVFVYSEAHANGPGEFDQVLPAPKRTLDFYREIAVVAYRSKPGNAEAAWLSDVRASSEQPDHTADNILDGKNDTFWVSGSYSLRQGPTPEKPEWLQLTLKEKMTIGSVSVMGRKGYGPKNCELQISNDGKKFKTIKSFSVQDGKKADIKFPAVQTKGVRLLMTSAYDVGAPNAPRNVQVVELELKDAKGNVFAGRKPIRMLDLKTSTREFGGSAPDCRSLLEDFPAQPGEEDCTSGEVLDLSKHLSPDGSLHWKVPAGEWTILRFGYTLSGAKVSTCSDGWDGLALDYLDPTAFQSYWHQIIGPLIEDAGPAAGRTLKYLHTDSWELGGASWTPNFRNEFRTRRGYDLLPFLPVLAGKIVDGRPASNRFLHDFRKTVGDCIADNHYRLMSQMGRQHGMGIHPESGGPHGAPIDSLRNLGISDVPMSEFWARSWRHRVGDVNRFFVKQPASAAHTYGRRLVAAEGFTTIGPHWQETIWDNLKPSFDQAACEGMNLLVWHAFTCSPSEAGLPGQEYFAGTHFNPQSTWWEKSGPFLAYINRTQFLLQQGLFVADACYYYGDNVPNFAQLKGADPAGILPGYDYDVATEEVLLERMSVKNGKIVLPDGMSYQMLVLPEQNGISLPVLRKVKDLVRDGATVIGSKPKSATGLRRPDASDREVRNLADELWGTAGQGEHAFGKGRVISGKSARQVCAQNGIKPDFEYAGGKPDSRFDYIHRCDREADIYFIANLTNSLENIQATFRVSGKTPELWDAVTGQIRTASAWTQKDGRTTVPLEFDPYGSIFVVFRKPAAAQGKGQRNFPAYSPVQEITGEWTVQFDPKWGGPERAQFAHLVSWTTRPEEGIKYYSGTATYRKQFDLAGTGAAQRRLVLDLGDVRNLAEVRLNGTRLGVLWMSPFRVDITDVVKSAGNVLEIEVVNFWPNRVIGDQCLPEEKRFTRTNVRKFLKDTPLLESGLLGPVRILVAE